MKRRTAAIATTLLATVTIVQAQLPAAWAHWPVSAPIDLPAATQPRLVRAIIPAAAAARVGTWNDFRVIDADGREVPFVLRARQGGTSAEWRPTRMLDPGVVATGQLAQATFDTGATARVHNAIRLQLQSPDDVLGWVEVATSADAREWQIVRARAPIYSLFRQSMGENETVSYPDSTARYLRVRLLEGSGSEQLIGAAVAYEVVTVAERAPAGIALAAAEAAAHRSAWVSSSDAPRVPVSEVRFESAQPSFARPVAVEGSDDGTTWWPAGSGQILRLVEAGQPRETMSVAFPEAVARHWRVTVYNHDDPPLADLRPALYATPRRVVFRQEPGARYSLLYGNARAAAPRYDLAQLTDTAALDAAVEGAIGAEVPNAGYDDPAPWTEKNPVVMWLALGAAVLVLAAIAIRTLRSG